MKQILCLTILFVCLSAKAQDIKTVPKDGDNAIRNEIILGLNTGVSFPLGAYADNIGQPNYDGNAGIGSVLGFDFGSNFKDSRFGWLLTGCLTRHHYNTNILGIISGGDYYNFGILLGATYALPLKNRSALTFSAQLGHINAVVPNYEITIETGNTYIPVNYKKVETYGDATSGNGILIGLGASYRLHFPKTIFYMLGTLNYQGASTHIYRRESVITTTFKPSGVIEVKSSPLDRDFIHQYSVINMQLGIGFFLK